MNNIYDEKINKIKKLLKIALDQNKLDRAFRLNSLLFVYQQKANAIDMQIVKENLK